MSESTPRAVFISYAREDTAAAQRLAEALRSHGVEVWFDQNELRGGDAWDAKIRRQINDCTLFLPIISAQTQERNKGYFRLEWKLAVEQTHLMAEGFAFLAPVVIDDTSESGAVVPPEFLRVQWTRLPGALPTPQFVERVKHLLAAPAKPVLDAGRLRPAMEAGRPRPAESASQAGPTGFGDPALQQSKKGIPGWAWGVVAAVIVAGAAVVMVSRKPEPAPATPVKEVVETKPAPAPAVLPKISEKSIAVLPFENMSEEKDASAFFADGMHEDILTNLALIHELRVVSRTSVMQYRNTTKPISQIAQELKVAYVLEGSVRRAGNKVRVTGQLIRAATDEHVWAKAFDRDVTDIFAIQSELAQAIAGALQAALSPQEKSLLERRPTENSAAYDLYLRARQIRGTGSDPLEKVEPLLRSAVELDPKFASAWAELASRDAFAYFNDIDHTDGRLAKAKEAIDIALRLAPDDPAVMEGAGDYYYYGYRDYGRAIEQYLRLAQLRPNDPTMYYSLALIHRRQGRLADSMKNFQRAAELDPSNQNTRLQFIGFLASTHRYAEAEAEARKLTQAYPGEVMPAWYLCITTFWARGSTKEMDDFDRQKFDPSEDEQVSYIRLQNARMRGDFTEAIRLAEKQRYNDSIIGDPHWSQDIAAAVTLADSGDLPAARARAEAAIPTMKSELELQPANATLWVALAMAQALNGNGDEALRCGQKGVELVPESRDGVDGPTRAAEFAAVLARVGEKDRALTEVGRLCRVQFGINVYQARLGMFGIASFHPLRGDPRFEALLADPKNNEPLF